MANPLNTVEIAIKPDASAPPSREISNIPWFPGMTVLDAMIVGDAMFDDTFTFKLVYASFYGAWVAEIDGLPNTANEYWILYVNGSSSVSGVSDTLLSGSLGGGSIELSWIYEDYSKLPPAAAEAMKVIQAV